MAVTADAAGAPVLVNADAPWKEFSSQDYWDQNYRELQPEDREILRRVRDFFVQAFSDRPHVRRAIDVGSGTNLYPALLMLPWTDQILLTDFSENNVDWLCKALTNEDAAWTWAPFWDELSAAEGYRQIGDPREHLLKACVGESGYAGVEQLSVFDLDEPAWDLGTMFFVAESITEDQEEFCAAVARFVGALTPGAPFAAAFMADSKGYPVDGKPFPALPIREGDVESCLTELGATGLSVTQPQTHHRVREGYEGMIVATGFARGR